VKKEILSRGGQADYIVSDLSTEENARTLAEKIKTEFGFIEFIVLNAGISTNSDILSQTAANFQKELYVNYIAPLLLLKELLDEMRGPAGRTMWEKLANVHEETLANYLMNEYPQTVAVIISRIKASHAAKVLLKFKLLELQRISLGDFTQWSVASAYLRNLHESHFAQEDFAAWIDRLLDDLVRAKVMQRIGPELINL
jgi:hypothetical protein